MATALNVKDMKFEDGKFKFRLRSIDGKGAARIVWGYVIPGAYPVVKVDGEHTYLWHLDPRIDQIVLEGSTHEDRRRAHEDEMAERYGGCRSSSDGEVCLWSGCPHRSENGWTREGVCPLYRPQQDELVLEEGS